MGQSRPYRATAVFEFICRCGKDLVSESKQGKCNHCGLEFNIIWPAEEVKLVEPKTISEVYGK